MTLGTFIKKLQAIQKQSGSRIPVCADIDSLKKTCNGVWSVIDISQMGIESVRQVDGDGFQKVRKDGFESERVCLVMR